MNNQSKDFLEKYGYIYAVNTKLTKNNWKCATCNRFININEPCVINHMTNNGEKNPDVRLELHDNCQWYFKESEAATETLEKYLDSVKDKLKNIEEHKDDFKVPENIHYEQEYDGIIFKADVEIESDWDEETINMAKDKAKEVLKNKIDNYINNKTIINKEQTSMETIIPSSDENMSQEHLINLRNSLNEIIGDTPEIISNLQEDMLDGDTTVTSFEQVTSWNRVLNAARKTIGKPKTDKEPSDSWKAKILLAEHSPIRLLEFDFGWERIKQWVSVHLVRHHIGFEKFVHSQRGDRRELPVDRDHIFQGAKNDMDATANAQALISISRKRLCNCASVETREAWSMVIDKLKKDNLVLASKCVPECVYRGFCPEWMSSCKYYTTDKYKQQLADYRNTKYGKDVIYKEFNNCLIFTNTGKVYINSEKIDIINDETYILSNCPEIFIEKIFDCNYKSYRLKVSDSDGNYYDVANTIYYLFNGKSIKDYSEYIKSTVVIHIDGNIWNNNIDNLKEIGII